MVGVSALALRHRQSAPGSGGDVKLELGYGGLTIRQSLLDTTHVSMSAELIAGGGLRCQRRTSGSRGGCPAAEGFGLLEGMLGADLRPTRWLTLAARVGYRFVFTGATPDAPVDISSPRSDDLSGLSASVGVTVRY